MARSWTLTGEVTRVVEGVNQKTSRPYQMLQVGGFSFWLEPEQFDHYVEGESVVMHGTFVRDVRTANGFEAVQVIDVIDRAAVGVIPRVSKGAPLPL